ncbi:RDD family protein [Flavobacterium sufflavum]|uniref:RDD family protein n=1 Tax=Flavobacterium sufflavum TaxID=1921138 RepID=A0A3S2V6H3_9FLAO|nr:RDD family protein [Flavobacterium sufflavum]RVT78414.1 RDD family protein [Flavobacterium sufflavum]
MEQFKIANYLLASKQKRVLNWIIDIIIMRFIVYLALTFMNSSAISNRINSFDMIERYLFWSIIIFIYYGITEVFLSRSLAKYFTKTIVVMEDGSKPDIITILVRTLVRIFPFEPLSFLRGRTLGLHDEKSRTFVVMKSKLEQRIEEHLVLESLEKVLK